MSPQKKSPTRALFLMVLQGLMGLTIGCSQALDIIDRHNPQGIPMVRQETQIPAAVADDVVHYVTLSAGSSLHELSSKISQKREQLGLSPHIPIDQQETFFQNSSWKMAKDILINSPMTGMVDHVCVHKGQQIQEGDLICTIECMKMVIEIRASSHGEATDFLYEAGNIVDKDSLLLKLLPPPSDWETIPPTQILEHKDFLIPFFPWASNPPPLEITPIPTTPAWVGEADNLSHLPMPEMTYLPSPSSILEENIIPQDIPVAPQNIGSERIDLTMPPEDEISRQDHVLEEESLPSPPVLLEENLIEQDISLAPQDIEMEREILKTLPEDEISQQEQGEEEGQFSSPSLILRSNAIPQIISIDPKEPILKGTPSSPFTASFTQELSNAFMGFLKKTSPHKEAKVSHTFTQIRQEHVLETNRSHQENRLFYREMENIFSKKRAEQEKKQFLQIKPSDDESTEWLKKKPYEKQSVPSSSSMVTWVKWICGLLALSQILIGLKIAIPFVLSRRHLFSKRNDLCAFNFRMNEFMTKNIAHNMNRKPFCKSNRA